MDLDKIPNVCVTPLQDPAKADQANYTVDIVTGVHDVVYNGLYILEGEVTGPHPPRV